jgi:CheY-like chemotaxis protein
MEKIWELMYLWWDVNEMSKILVIDDETNIREILCEIIESLSFDTLSARNGIEGIEIFNNNKEEIVCIILDITMPLMMGNEVYDKIRETSNVPIIITSGYNPSFFTGSYKNLNLTRYIQKPYNREAIAKALAFLL